MTKLKTNESKFIREKGNVMAILKITSTKQILARTMHEEIIADFCIKYLPRIHAKEFTKSTIYNVDITEKLVKSTYDDFAILHVKVKKRIVGYVNVIGYRT